MADRISFKKTQSNLELLQNVIAYLIWAMQSKAKNKENLSSVWDQKLKKETKDLYMKMADVSIWAFDNFDTIKKNYNKETQK